MGTKRIELRSWAVGMVVFNGVVHGIIVSGHTIAISGSSQTGRLFDLRLKDVVTRHTSRATWLFLVIEALAHSECAEIRDRFVWNTATEVKSRFKAVGIFWSSMSGEKSGCERRRHHGGSYDCRNWTVHTEHLNSRELIKVIYCILYCCDETMFSQCRLHAIA